MSSKCKTSKCGTNLLHLLEKMCTKPVLSVLKLNCNYQNFRLYADSCLMSRKFKFTEWIYNKNHFN
jgi:hypothetical protein